MSGKGLMCRLYKELLQLQKKKMNNSIKNGQNIWFTFLQRRYANGQKCKSSECLRLTGLQGNANQSQETPLRASGDGLWDACWRECKPTATGKVQWLDTEFPRRPVSTPENKTRHTKTFP